MTWYLTVLKKYAVFDGRARKKEFWLFTLFNTLAGTAFVMIVGAVLGDRNADLIYSLAVLLPVIGVTIRRLHDTNHSGWWMFVNIVPLIGNILFLVFLCQDSDQGDNSFGPNPKLEN